MKPTRIHTLLLPFAALIPAMSLQAAVNINSVATPDAFPAIPAVADWSTLSVAGTAPADAAALDAAVIANTNATAVATVLGSSTTTPPSTNAIGRFNATHNFLQTRPTGNAYTLLMATMTNATGGDLNTVRVAYDYSKATDTATEQIKGFRVYWSFTGAPNSWMVIPALSVDSTGTIAAQQPISASIPLPSPLASGGTLYLLFADQNSSGTDASYHIDNFAASPGINCAISGSATSAVRDSGADPADPTDDNVSFSATVTGTGDLSPSGFVVTAPASLAGLTGTYGTPLAINTPVSSFTNGSIKIEVADASEPACAAAFSTSTTRVIGTNLITGSSLPILTAAPVTSAWSIDDATRISTQNAATQADHVVESASIDLSSFGFASVTAELSAITGASSGFEGADSFTMEVIIDGGTPVSVLGSSDTNNDGRLRGANTTLVSDELPEADLTNTTRDFSFNYVIPATANDVKIRFIGNSNSTSETLVVKNLTIAPSPATLFTTLAAAPVINSHGTVDPSDDTYSAPVTILPVNLGEANVGWTSNAPPPASGLYSAANPVTFGPYPLSAGPTSITLTDTVDPAVTTSFVITPPAPVLTVSAPANILRHENGPGVDDDTVTFDVVVTGSAGPSWDATGAVTASGSYGPGTVTLTIPAPLAASPAAVTFTDVSYPAATQTVNVAYPGRYVIGQASLGAGVVDLLSDPASAPDALWVNDATARTLKMTAGIATDSVVNSDVLNLASVGKVYFSANLNAAETSATSNFEATDRFKAELKIDAGLPTETIINLIDARDVGNGASSTAVATNGLNGPKNGYINGYNGTAGTDIVTGVVHATAAEEYLANSARDEFNSGAEAVSAQLNNNFALSYEIPASANTVQLIITGAGASGTETLTVSDVLFTSSPPSPPTADNDSDGVSNGDEAIMGTDPNDAKDVLRLSSSAANPGQIQFPGKAGRYYRVYVSDDANEASHLLVWKDSGLATIVGNGSTASFDIDVLPGEKRRFYRLHVMQTDGNGGLWPETAP